MTPREGSPRSLPAAPPTPVSTLRVDLERSLLNRRPQHLEIVASTWVRAAAGEPVSSAAEDSHSGRVRTLGKRVGGNPSRVQIPHPPLSLHRTSRAPHPRARHTSRSTRRGRSAASCGVAEHAAQDLAPQRRRGGDRERADRGRHRLATSAARRTAPSPPCRRSWRAAGQGRPERRAAGAVGAAAAPAGEPASRTPTRGRPPAPYFACSGDAATACVLRGRVDRAPSATAAPAAGSRRPASARPARTAP